MSDFVLSLPSFHPALLYVGFVVVFYGFYLFSYYIVPFCDDVVSR